MKDNKYSQLCAFLQDTRQFILKTRYITHTVPLQLYSSGLIFAPTKSIIQQIFKKNIPDWINKIARSQRTLECRFGDP